MGGFGSGRWSRWDSKSTTDEYRRTDVRRWAREGALTPGQGSSFSPASCLLSTESSKNSELGIHARRNEGSV